MNRARGLAAIAALGAVGHARPARAAEFTYRLAHPDPVDDPIHVAVAQMAEAVRKETGGRLDIQIFPNSILGSQAAMLSLLRLGSVQFVWMNQSAFSTVIPVTQIVATGFAFSTNGQALRGLDGSLGAYIRKEFAAKGMFVFTQSGLTGFRQMTSSVKPIRTVDDLAGYKVRTLPAAIFVDLFKTLGASPVALSSDQIYTSAQTHLVDGVELPLVTIEAFRVYEVQKYVSFTNHIWGGYWLAANPAAWGALPPDLQSAVERNVAKYVIRQRREYTVLDASIEDKLKRQGLTFNTADVSGMRARLGSYYARWKGEFGPVAWGLLEESAGKLS